MKERKNRRKIGFKISFIYMSICSKNCTQSKHLCLLTILHLVWKSAWYSFAWVDWKLPWFCMHCTVENTITDSCKVSWLRHATVMELCKSRNLTLSTVLWWLFMLNTQCINVFGPLMWIRFSSVNITLWYFKKEKGFAWDMSSRVIHYSLVKMSYAMKY